MSFNRIKPRYTPKDLLRPNKLNLANKPNLATIITTVKNIDKNINKY